LVILGSQAGTFAQSIGITGTVVDSSSSQGIANASVRLIEYPQFTATSIANGSFTLSGTVTAAIGAPSPSQPPSIGVELQGATVKIRRERDAGSVTVDAFTCDGARISSRRLPRSAEATDARFAGAEPAALAKSGASYTLEVAAPGYATKQIAQSGPTGNAGTIRLAAGHTQAGAWTKMAMPVPFTYAMSLLHDPVRPSDYYGFLTDGSTTPITVVKSTDYGATWKTVNVGTMKGDPWGAAIDPNPKRDPGTPPTLYTPCGYGSWGLWKSTDGGITWTQTIGNQSASALAAISVYWPPDLYSVSILPDNPPNHLLVTFHDGGWKNSADQGLGESTDGGLTWFVHQPPAGMGASQYLVILDATTWMSVAQDYSGGIWKTTTAGRDNGAISATAWKKVDSLTHFHGSFMAAVTPKAIYVPGNGGIRRSADNGETWSWGYSVGAGNYMTSVVATAKYLYADNLLGPNLRRSPIGDGTQWATYCPTPSGMAGSAGPGTSTHYASTDGTSWYVVCFNNGGGVWRYIEP